MNTILGLDVGKKWLDACFYKEGTKPLYTRFSNDTLGHKALLAYLDEVSVNLIVCEPTGGYERAICEQLHYNNVPIHQVETYKFSAFSKSMDNCKTDKHDAFKLAYYGHERKLRANYTYQVERDRLKRQQQRREDLVIILGNEKKRLHHSQSGIDRESIESLINFLEKEIKSIDKQLTKSVESSKELQDKATILQTIPGIGVCLATKLVTALPELGDANYSSNQLSALVGIAPYPNESGKKRAKDSLAVGGKYHEMRYTWLS